MKERLQKLLDMEHLTPARFADLIGVQRSSVSHVLSGRNKPSFDFLEKTLKAFPGLEADWLILGKGHMYEQMGRSVETELFGKEDDIHLTVPEEETEQVVRADSKRAQEETDTPHEEPNKGDGERKIVRVLVFYEDNTFSSYSPSE